MNDQGQGTGGSGPAAGSGVADTDRWKRVGDERAAQAAEKLKRLANSGAETAARARYLEMFGAKAGEVVIDVGAGSGVITAEIAKRVAPGGRVFAIDPSQALLDVARETAREAGVGPQVDCRVADGRDLPFGLSAFDAAFCHWVLLHVDNPERIIAEMRRVTRRGGRVLAVEADWETVMLWPADRIVTRRILNHAADRNHEPWIGRRLPLLFAGQGFSELTVEPIVAIDRGGEDRAWLEYLFERAALAVAAGVVQRDEAIAWMAKLDRGFKEGEFFFAVTQFAVLGRVPG